MSIQSEISRISNNVGDTFAAITEMGGSVPTNATSNDMANAVRTIPVVSLLDAHPVGSIYSSVNSTSPASLFGGTWERLRDRFLLGAGNSYTAGSTGGAATHKLTESEMPQHYHLGLHYTGNLKTLTLNGGTSGYNLGWTQDKGSSSSDIATGYAGGSAAHNNMPPYLAVYMWKRVS